MTARDESGTGNPVYHGPPVLHLRHLKQ